MRLKIDNTKTYAIALEGGGAKGAYEVGVWRALDEAGIKYNAVAGSSVGSLNGAMMAMGDLERAITLWENIRFSQVMAVDDDFMQRVFQRDLRHLELRSLVRRATDVVKDGGLDVQPLRHLLAEVIDEDRVRNSPVNFYLVTFSITDRKELDIDAKTLKKGQLHDMLLASAYFPAFKNEKLGGKRYTDGGLQDAIPIDSLVSRGYRDIIAVRIFGYGREKKVRIPAGTQVLTIAPTAKLGQLLNFSSEQSRRLLKLGYFDGLRALYGLAGTSYYIDPTWDEDEAYSLLVFLARERVRRREGRVSRRYVNETLLPRMAKDLGQTGGTYYDLAVALLEMAAVALDLDPWQVLTDQELYAQVREARSRRLSKELPKAALWIPRE